MALPMAHLLSAYLWAHEDPQLQNCPEYYLGSIAPDAIHIRDGSDKSNKDLVHMNNWRRPNEARVVEYWQEHSTPFDLGYGIHVLLDGHWAQRFRGDFPQILDPNGRPIPELYYNDAYAADRKLYTSCEHTEFFLEMLRKAQAPEGHPYLLRTEFEQWRDATIEFYLSPNRKCGVSKYITYDYMLEYIRRCPGMFTDVYRTAFQVDC